MGEAKALLIEVKRQISYVHTLEEELKQLRLEAMQLKSPSIGDAVQNNHQADLSETVERIEEYAGKVQGEVDRLIRMKLDAELLIKADPDRTRRAVLRRRYFLCQSWTEISSAMHYGKTVIFKMHHDSLDVLDLYLKEGKRAE